MQRFSSSGTRQGIILVIVAMVCFAALDTLSKYLSSMVSIVIALWTRYALQTLITGLMILPKRGLGVLRMRHPWLQILRGLTIVISSAIAYYTLRFVPLGEFTAILMLTPMVITLFAARWMGEVVSWGRWVLLIGSLLGALLVIRPGTVDFHWVMLLPVLLVLTSAAFQLLTSHLSRDDDPAAMHLFTGIVATLSVSGLAPFYWDWPTSLITWVLLGLLGVCSTLGHYLLILGYGRARPGVLAPFIYFQVVFAALSGWLVFAHQPDFWSVSGMVVIVVCGLLGNWLRNRQEARHEAREQARLQERQRAQPIEIEPTV